MRHLPAILFALLLGAAAFGAEPPAESVWSHTAGPGLDMSLSALDGHDVLLKPSGSSVLLLHFWATWCGPCLEELPALDTLAADLAARGVSVLAISEDRGGASDVRKYFDRHSAPAHVATLLDPQRAAAKALHIGTLPTTVVMGCDGTEHARLTGTGQWAGGTDRAALDAVLADLAARCRQ